MTDKERDPFERLSQIAAPEPDPQKVESVAAMSAHAFTGSQKKKPDGSRSSWFSNVFAGRGWAFPVTAGAVAVVAGIVVVPMMGQPETAPDTVLSRSPEAVADAPLPMAPPAAVAPETDVRMGAAPTPQGQPIPLDLREDAESERYEFDSVSLMVRNAPDAAGIYYLTGDVERQIDQRVKEPAETLTISDALLYNRDAIDLLLIRSGLNAASQQWDAFMQDNSGYSLSGSISAEIQDAQDRAEVVERLENPAN